MAVWGEAVCGVVAVLVREAPLRAIHRRVRVPGRRLVPGRCRCSGGGGVAADGGEEAGAEGVRGAAAGSIAAMLTRVSME